MKREFHVQFCERRGVQFPSATLLGGQRGSLTSPSDRRTAVLLIEEANRAGARLRKCVSELGLSIRTFERFGSQGEHTRDMRLGAQHPSPGNALSTEERQSILDVCHSKEFSSLPPTQIVPALSDRGIYLASESTFYRILRAHKEQHRRTRAQKPQKRQIPVHRAAAIGDIWVTDISWLRGPVEGAFFYLYFVMDLYSRKIVGYEVYGRESSQYLADVIQRATLREGGSAPKILHSDNGSPMKGTALLALCYDLGIVTTNSRPRVSDDNPHIEALFRTTKYWPGYPYGGFSDLNAARVWIETFVTYYNDHHRHSALNFVTASEMHNGGHIEILAQRQALYEKSKMKNPSRWISGKIRNWSPATDTWTTPSAAQRERRLATA